MTKEKGQETIIVLALVCLVAFVKFEALWLIYVALSFLVISLLSKRLTIAIGALWLSFSHYFGLIMNYFIMFFIFYCILTPISFFQKLFGHNQILKKNRRGSYFHAKNHYYSNNDIEKPW
ncbi:SxtJ family membrane protein [Mangrovimonas sp. YM274]|uniref:SxtJ family membrane protein n=1 Tax=Mangrovimonas sp. YM274 TaxID=3070660 RepID=UPI0027DBF3AB|nr:SxtJ family membrane protein [Mangrovimonas sp. YM274]WMI67743.1 SxtJ family membrane protein [Mangrovimonas sp. YM274]